MKNILIFILLAGSVFAQSTKVGGSGTTKVGGSGATKVGAVAASSSPPAFRSEAHADGDGSGNVTIAKPTGTADNDLMIAEIGTDNAGSTITPPAGWTSRGKLTSAVDAATYEVFTKKAASEGANYVFVSSTPAAAGFIISYSGVNTSTPLDATTTTNTGTNGASPTTITGTAITTVTANCTIVWVAGLDANGAGDAVFTAPSSYTIRADAVGGSNFVNAGAADAAQPAAGSSGSLAGSATYSGGSAGWCAFVLALRPQ